MMGLNHVQRLITGAGAAGAVGGRWGAGWGRGWGLRIRTGKGL